MAIINIAPRLLPAMIHSALEPDPSVLLPAPVPLLSFMILIWPRIVRMRDMRTQWPASVALYACAICNDRAVATPAPGAVNIIMQKSLMHAGSINYTMYEMIKVITKR